MDQSCTFVNVYMEKYILELEMVCILCLEGEVKLLHLLHTTKTKEVAP